MFCLADLNIKIREHGRNTPLLYLKKYLMICPLFENENEGCPVMKLYYLRLAVGSFPNLEAPTGFHGLHRTLLIPLEFLSVLMLCMSVRQSVGRPNVFRLLS